MFHKVSYKWLYENLSYTRTWGVLQECGKIVETVCLCEELSGGYLEVLCLCEELVGVTWRLSDL